MTGLSVPVTLSPPLLLSRSLPASVSLPILPFNLSLSPYCFTCLSDLPLYPSLSSSHSTCLSLNHSTCLSDLNLYHTLSISHYLPLFSSLPSIQPVSLSLLFHLSIWSPSKPVSLTLPLFLSLSTSLHPLWATLQSTWSLSMYLSFLVIHSTFLFFYLSAWSLLKTVCFLPLRLLYLSLSRCACVYCFTCLISHNTCLFLYYSTCLSDLSLFTPPYSSCLSHYLSVSLSLVFHLSVCFPTIPVSLSAVLPVCLISL